jgi:acetylornithine deacetylase/succinyl-diaminopimelate desuccinylase-like protein
MNAKKAVFPLAAALLYAAVALVARAFAAAPDWKPLEEEAVAILSRYIRVNTANPPGNEIQAAQFLREIFEKEGIETRIIESAPGRGNIFARLRGDGSKKALVLLHHMDVVPADAKHWQEPPFSGTVKGGEIWGRGALDNKGPGIAELMALLALKRHNLALKGDVIFLGTADEEAGGALGAGYVLEKHPELFANVGLVLNEGGGVRLGKDGKAREYSIGMAEKTPLWLRLTAPGQAGHGSLPGNNLAVHRLIAVLERITRYQPPIRVVPEVQKYYQQIASTETGERRQRYSDLKTALLDPAFAAEFTRDPRNNANVRSTHSITVLQASDKTNVIPGEASAEIDARLLPGEDPQDFIRELRTAMNDDAIKIEVLLSFPPAVSPPHPQALRLISDMAARDGGAPVVTPLGRGFTDCRFFRQKNIPCLGFMPLRSPASQAGLAHGNNERIGIGSLRAGIRALYEIVHKLAAE